MPLTDVELDAKFLELAEPVLGAPGAAALLQRLWRLETLRMRDLPPEPSRLRQTTP